MTKMRICNNAKQCPRGTLTTDKHCPVCGNWTTEIKLPDNEEKTRELTLSDGEVASLLTAIKYAEVNAVDKELKRNFKKLERAINARLSE